MPSIDLPTAGRRLEAYRLGPPRHFPAPARPFSRIAFAAAHVVADPWAAADPWHAAAIDWDATMAYRRHLWPLGLGVAEAWTLASAAWVSAGRIAWS